MNRGHFLTARKIFTSAIWTKPPMYLKAWTWIYGRAVFQDGHVVKGHELERGELLTTYSEMADALAYQRNRAIIKPTVKELRVILEWLASQGMITVKPLRAGTLPNQGRHQDSTRAYLGLLITVTNYDTYQDPESYKGRNKGRHPSEQGQIEKECRDIMTVTHAEIVDLYHEILPDLPKVIAWSDPRKRKLNARLKEDKNRQGLPWWREYFVTVGRSPFLMGKKTDFRADLEWLIEARNMPKVLEGRYLETTAPPPRPDDPQEVRMVACSSCGNEYENITLVNGVCYRCVSGGSETTKEEIEDGRCT